MEVKRTADKVWIEGVKGFGPGEYARTHDRAAIKAIEQALAVLSPPSP
ncbi:MAG: hypothetical protein QGH42_12200 [Kiritimatiellia bacterium]|jgi:hypothetical protein|nr:hypothetical protein [Planctomycetota bacterium]MDP6631750.1 hypothetical protein [Kiritimatiellia bacterium]MDP6810496.1 hypothetical protein [Kiritimatiellia bacterium]MDP7024986.1 hypothetical protein [Kiritimatiellia bacterium]